MPQKRNVNNGTMVPLPQWIAGLPQARIATPIVLDFAGKRD